MEEEHKRVMGISVKGEESELNDSYDGIDTEEKEKTVNGNVRTEEDKSNESGRFELSYRRTRIHDKGRWRRTQILVVKAIFAH
jgi:hypothetical protein